MRRTTTELCRWLAKLDRLRTKLGGLADQEKELAARCVAELQRLKLERLNFGPNRAAVLVTPTSYILDVEAFRRTAEAAGIAAAEIEAAIEVTVGNGKARKLLGPERFEQIAAAKSGKPQVKISGARKND